MSPPVLGPLPDYREYAADVMKRRAADFYDDIRRRRFLILVAGYPAGDATVPAITKKPLEQIATFI